MNIDYDFVEIKNSVVLMFYLSPNCPNTPEIKLINPITLLYNDQKIDLYAPVELAVVKKTTHYIEVVLTKKIPQKWKSINGKESKFSTNSQPKVNNMINEGENSTGIYDMVAEIYSKGNNDVRRAMNKSLLESEGTVLSTDWESVSKHKVEPKH